MFLIIKSIWIVFALSVYAFSYDDGLRVLTEDLLKSHPSLHASKLQVRQGESQIRQSGTLPNPTLSYARMGESFATWNGAMEQRINLNQSIPWPGLVINSKKVASAATAQFQYESQKMASDLLLQLRLNWAQAQYHLASLQLLDSVIVLYDLRLNRLMADYKSGLSPYQRVLKLRNERRQIQDRQLIQQRELINVQEQIRELTGRSLADITQILNQNKPISILQKNLELASLDDSNNPSLGLAKSRIKTSEARLNMSQQGYYPDLSVGLGYIYITNPAGMGEVTDHRWSVNAGISLPINISRTSAAVEEQSLGLSRVEQDMQALKRYLKRESEQQLNLYTESLRRYKLYESEMLADINQSIAVLEKSWSAGNVDFMQLLDDYRMRLEYQLVLVESNKNAYQALYKILWLSGDTSAQIQIPIQSTALQTEEN